MAIREIVLGDDIGIPIYLYVRVGVNRVKTLANIDSAATVKVSLIDLDSETEVLTATPANNLSFTDKTGTLHTASWGTGLVVATWTKEAVTAAAIANNDVLHLEVQVDDNGRTTWPVGSFPAYVFKQDYIDQNPV